MAQLGKLRRDADRPADADVTAPRPRLPRARRRRRAADQRTLPRVVTAALAAVLLAVGTPLGFLVVKDQPVAALNSKAWLDEE